MIFNGLIGGIFSIVDWALSPLGNITINFNVEVVKPVIEFLRIIYYLLPIDNIYPLFVVVISLMGFKLTISILKTFMSIMPIV